MTTINLSDIALPAGAAHVDPWTDEGKPTANRYFETPRTLIACERGDVAVFALGLQYPNGSCMREIRLHELHADDPITVGEARQIARALMQMADAVERWSIEE